MQKRKKFQNKRWRRQWQYICALCGKKRRTLIFIRMKQGQCHKCEPEVIDPNQGVLFPKQETQIV